MAMPVIPADSNALLIQVERCLTPFEEIRDAAILCRGGLIYAVGGASAFEGITDIPRLPLPGCCAIPGMVDTHIHGSGNVSLMNLNGIDELQSMSAVLAEHGVTTFLPTLITAPEAVLLPKIRLLAEACSRTDYPGAVPAGLHLEGPYLSYEARGTQPQCVRDVDLGEVERILEAGAGKIRIMTFAPERAGALDLVRRLKEAGVVPSMGHTTADASVVLAAVDAGATRCTHLFNGMPAIHHRNVSLAAVALTDDRLTVELTADGVHVHPRMIDLAFRAKSAAQVVAISDAVQGTGIKEGNYRLGDERIRIEHGASRRLSDGRLAGSCISLDTALRNLHRFSALDSMEAVACCTINAAKSIGLRDRGAIEPGKRADIVVLDAEGTVTFTMIGGRIAYHRDGVGAAGAQ